MSKDKVFIGKNEVHKTQGEVSGTYLEFEKEDYFKISNSHKMRPFFMSIVSDSNHWMFISSNGALTAGRRNSESSLFPYYTDDKITESLEITGSKTIIRVSAKEGRQIWEPFSDRFEGAYQIQRNIYKNIYGNKIIFEEINQDLGLTFKYQWNSSNRFGFVRRAFLTNNNTDQVRLELLDGLQNILPYGVNTDLQNVRSNLVDAYKRSELHSEAGIGIYALSAIIVDKAEPSEALKASIAWSLGMEQSTHLLSSLQLAKFRNGGAVEGETDIKAEKGAYFINSDIALESGSTRQWMMVANVNQSVSNIVEIAQKINNNSGLQQEVLDDIQLGTTNLIQLAAAADGLQLSSDQLRCARHYSNVLYNIMRGGIFDHNYEIEKWDFENYLSKANKEVFGRHQQDISEMKDVFTLFDLRALADKSSDLDFRRLCGEYLPLKFSRRHGDPSRPWNKFSINTRSEIDGTKILDYEGNWRDIFQNWEALAHAYPEFIDNMIFKFLNASTFEGYNPYRVTKDGFDWEIIEPEDPWSYIGYWGDHQIIYLLKFLEFIRDYFPGRLDSYFEQEIFVYANVPYIIKSYDDILKNSKDTIDFDDDLDKTIRERRESMGADGALLTDQNSEICRVNLIEKLLATLLAKCSNFIPEGGIWLNTQRPEWNDANNALVGNGVSMVTLYYLRRFLKFLSLILGESNMTHVMISSELAEFFHALNKTLEDHSKLLSSGISDSDRKKILDGLGQPASDFREKIYKESFSGSKEPLSKEDLAGFVDIALKYMEHSIDANKKEDGMYHAYNLMSLNVDGGVSISYLSEMLEGQVAVLSSGYLSAADCDTLLNSMKKSALYRKDQYSYLLYPDKELPGFMVKNVIPETAVKRSTLLQQLLDDGDRSILEGDIGGEYHFNGSFNNANDLIATLEGLSEERYASLVEKDRDLVLEIFEEVFDHKSFTGRSGTFFGYEGLGSIYWHMVSKLLLAVEECCLQAIGNNEDRTLINDLLDHYNEINEGIGVHKSPELYGAFPTDPYSHTPATKGAQQPGMTGQVKEDILSRMGEFGISVKEGLIGFNSDMLNKDEFLNEEKIFSYTTVLGEAKEISVSAGCLAFTIGQVPVIYCLGDEEGLTVKFVNSEDFSSNTLKLNDTISRSVMERKGEVEQILVTLAN